jgi:hypothetical protein
MPTYAQQWQNVWNPYVNYALGGNPTQVKDRLEQFYLSQILGAVDSPFFTDVDAYRNACRNLKQNPTDGTLANQVQTMHASLRGHAANTFQPRAKAAQQRLKGAMDAVGKANELGLIQGGQQTMLIKSMVIEIVLISGRLKEDQDRYTERNAARTLDEIRLNG